MLLAFQGTEVSEAQLIQKVDLQAGGLNPQELSQLAREYGLPALEQSLSSNELFDLISQNRFPIVFVNRRFLDAADMGHAVIPVSVSRYFITFPDPLRGKRRVLIRKFEACRALVGNWVVAWDPS